MSERAYQSRSFCRGWPNYTSSPRYQAVANTMASKWHKEFFVRGRTPVRHEGSAHVCIKGIPVNSNTPVTMRSVAGAHAASIRTAIGRVGTLRHINTSVIHISMPAVSTTRTFGLVGRQIGIPLITSVRFSCHVTLGMTRCNISYLHVGPNGVNGRRHVHVMISYTHSGGVPVHVNIGTKSLRGSLRRGCNRPAPRTLLRSTVHRISRLSHLGFSRFGIDIGTSSIFLTIRSCHLLTGRVSRPLRLKVARTNNTHDKTMGSTVNLNLLLSRNVNSALHMSLTTSPIRRVGINFSVLGSLHVHSQNVGFVTYPAYSHRRFSIVNAIGTLRRHLRSVVAPVSISVVNYIIGNPNRTLISALNIANNGGGDNLCRSNIHGSHLSGGSVVSRLRTHVHTGTDRLSRTHQVSIRRIRGWWHSKGHLTSHM